MSEITLDRQAEAVERWKAEKGVTGRDYVPVNSGSRRTTSKREMLDAIKKAAARRGLEPRFFAKY